MNDPAVYLSELEFALLASPIVSEYRVVRSWANTDDGYIRIRARLMNGDFLEAIEYFALQGDQIVTVDYRHQWMDGNRQSLRQRWDSTRDHPALPDFPYHVHTGDEKTVSPSHPLSVLEVLKLIEGTLLSA
ncbi:MAG: DUF6516 family protein [Chloroflexi bacterium]|nr:DUF6516 family protein [Chloroflexota bacterium]